MKKQLKKLFVIALAILIASSCCVVGYASDISGTTGEVSWYYLSSENTLSIEGEGYMDDYITDDGIAARPWDSIADEIEIVAIEEGVVNAGDGAFANFTALKYIHLSPTVYYIGVESFAGCTGVRTADVGVNTMYIDESAFKGCTSLNLITAHPQLFYLGESAFADCPAIEDIIFRGMEVQLDLIMIEEGNDAVLNADIHCVEKEYDAVITPGEQIGITYIDVEPFDLIVEPNSGIKVIEKETAGSNNYYGVGLLVEGVTCSENLIYVVNEYEEVVDIITVAVECGSDHNYTEDTVIREGTCCDYVVYYSSCKDCENTRINRAGFGEHSFSDYVVTKPATCVEAGVETATCTLCGETQDRELPTGGHTFGDWVVTLEPTVDAEGSQTRTCTSCGVTETEVIPVLSTLIGDVNGDGKLSALDGRYILLHTVGTRTLNDHYASLADLNGDGKISAMDARWILQIATGIRKDPNLPADEDENPDVEEE